MRHVLQSETEVDEAQLLKFFDTKDDLRIHVRCKGLVEDEDSLEPLVANFEEVSAMLDRLRKSKTTLNDMAVKVSSDCDLLNQELWPQAVASERLQKWWEENRKTVQHQRA